MRVLLIYPPISIQERYSSDIGHAGGKQMPLGIYYLAAYLRKGKHDVRVIDAEANDMSYEQIISVAQGFLPQVIGISSTTVAFHRALSVAGFLKEKMPNVITVIGGPHPTAAVEDVMSNKEFDYAILGEGEIAFQNFLDALQYNADYKSLAGLAYRGKEKIHVNHPNIIEHINELPFPAYDMINNFSLYNPPPMNYRKLPVANIITSRGCPNQCTFCDHSIFGRTLKQRSPENIAEEIELLFKHYGIREIAFVDDTFTINPERIKILFKYLNQKNIHFPWTCMSRINTVDEDMLLFMKDHGCWHISFGIESGNENILQLIKKNISLDAVKKIIETCYRLGILTKGFFIIGHPGETEETIEQTIQFALSIPLDDVVVTLNTPLPGTAQYRTAQEYGRLDNADWSKYNMWNPVFIPKGLTTEILLKKHHEFYRRFYLRPRIVKRYAISFLSKAGMRRAFSLVRTLPFLFSNKLNVNQTR
jgi:anaerobic magnesium-protoporphyrin IX monomethyl ester cyclase